jgi:16S rRNA (uracil1498-N3)-methyltransferase
MLPRFYASIVAGDLVTLAEDEAHHLAHVMRLGPGDTIAVFDGRGAEWRGRVESVGRRGAQVRLLDQLQAVAEPRVALTLAQAALKGDGMEAVVRDATMLGVIAVQPLISRRTIARAAGIQGDKARDRLRRVAIASAKQCRRAVVPEIRPAVRFDEWIETAGKAYILVEPGAPEAGGSTGGAVDRDQPLSTLSAATLIVGPEGGWEAAELEAARQTGCTRLTLGPRTLRADSAAVVAMAALRGIWGDF